MSDTVFTKVDYQLGTLISQIELGEIGLPDLQRPFVWAPVKVRDLFDSMYRGYPVGHLLFWASGAEPGARQIGAERKQLAPRLLIVDGQQRLTSLFAVMKQQPIVGKDYARKRIQIAFKPSDGTFSVVDAATAKNPEYMQDIGEMWSRPAYAVINEFLERLRGAGSLEDDRERQIAEALQRLEALRGYPFTALVLGADVEEAQVAEVFVRTNSQGKQLNQADFILTLMSVYWDEGRIALERWSREVRTPGDPAYNAYLSPEPDQLLRVGIALGFRRGRLEDAYTVLRGRDPGTGKISPELREMQFKRLAEAQSLVLDKEVWKEFLQCLPPGWPQVLGDDQLEPRRRVLLRALPDRQARLQGAAEAAARGDRALVLHELGHRPVLGQPRDDDRGRSRFTPTGEQPGRFRPPARRGDLAAADKRLLGDHAPRGTGDLGKPVAVAVRVSRVAEHPRRAGALLEDAVLGALRPRSHGREGQGPAASPLPAQVPRGSRNHGPPGREPDRQPRGSRVA